MRDAEFRHSVIEPLLRLGPTRTRAQVEAVARDHGCDPATVYRWLKKYEATESVRGLMRRVRSDRGGGRLPDALEKLMDSLIEQDYLTEQRPTMQNVYERLKSEVDRANRTRAEGEPELRLPGFQTFRRRIYRIEERRRVSRRFGGRAARVLDPVLGHYPGATYPLAVVQIDHTPLDIQLVDTVHRLPIGRPWITLVMDVFSRVVLGFYISFDNPNAFAAGAALTHAILPKDLWLARHEEALDRILGLLRAEMGEAVVGDHTSKLDWPCYGRPVLVKMDNAREFRGHMIERALREHVSDREFRPVLRPQYGGHIERLLGTLLREIHTLPGTTFSNPRARGDYDAEEEATITLEAFETWLTAYILGVYHRRVHSELDMTPLAAWEAGLLHGSDDHPPTGLPERIMGDRADRLRMDFLPFFEATVQRTGIRHGGLIYMSDVLRRYIGARHPDHPTRARKFLVSYDPRDVSAVYFLDPDLDRYFEVRCRQPNFPSMSIWELRATRVFARKHRIKLEDERAVMNTFRLMRRLVQGEEEQTKSVRAEAEKQRQRARVDRPAGAEKAEPPSKDRSALNPFKKAREIKPFDDIE
ncbi:transposase [Deinococcus metallilatus]|uniref:DDE-type integrase/transposase/recombinase n=1 Tax=Deinococcus metallilatus TaxID=1211322 RepID=A0AAJ5F509_9DEIO|nr:transposase [Deinococcus metallilatus]RXJ14195.1 transposase [Deinococcus metallilatus]TLK30162.1 DDE-type integrase/transposase/recombinase [Deinococcus metallilatus]